MYTLGISNFPIPGENGFPLNGMYTKPSNRGEEGEDLALQGWGFCGFFRICGFFLVVNAGL